MSLKKISKGNQQREKEIQEELYQCINQKESIILIPVQVLVKHMH